MERGLRKFDDFKDHKSLIEELMEDRVLNIKYSKLDNVFFMREMCDQYFSTVLDEEKCSQLSSLFSDLAKKISEYKENPPKEHYEAINQEKLEDEQRRLQKEEKESRKLFGEKSTKENKNTLTVTDCLMITLHEEKLILYSYLTSFSKRDDGYMEASFTYGDCETRSNTGKTYKGIIGETIAHDEYGVPRMRIKISFKEIKLIGNKMLFKEQDMKIEEEYIAS